MAQSNNSPRSLVSSFFDLLIYRRLVRFEQNVTWQVGLRPTPNVRLRVKMWKISRQFDVAMNSASVHTTTRWSWWKLRQKNWLMVSCFLRRARKESRWRNIFLLRLPPNCSIQASRHLHSEPHTYAGANPISQEIVIALLQSRESFTGLKRRVPCWLGPNECHTEFA